MLKKRMDIKFRKTLHMLSIECLHEIQNKYDIYAVFKGKSSQMDV